MNNFEIYWPWFCGVMAILAAYGVKLSYQKPEMWIRRASLVIAPLISTAALKLAALTLADPTWPNWFSAVLGLWVSSLVLFLFGCFIGNLANKFFYEETLDQINKDKRFR